MHCPQCCLACHKKCLETLAIQCGHKKLQGRLQLFGQDFGQAARATPDGVPFIVKKCVCEIERRALRTKVTPVGTAAGASSQRHREGRQVWAEADRGPPQGIYRVNGVKTRVEKLCQAFENGKELVELSQASPHDISNVLKLYLRQVSPMGEEQILGRTQADRGGASWGCGLLGQGCGQGKSRSGYGLGWDQHLAEVGLMLGAWPGKDRRGLGQDHS